MSEHQCQPELLVAYADGEVSVNEASNVEKHLAVCDDCRRTLAALQKSLSLAQANWQEYEITLQDFSPRKSVPGRRFRLASTVTIAAAVVLMLCGSLGWFTSSSWHRSSGGNQTKLANADPAEIRLQVEREGSAARLLASARLLSEAPGGEPLARERLEQIIAEFPETSAAQAARGRLSTERTNG